MTTRMERVAEDIALATLRKASTLAEQPLHPEKLQEGFNAKWPAQDSRLPMNEAMSAAVGAATNSTHAPDRESWKARIVDAWGKAVEEVVLGYFRAAQHSFEKGQSLEGVETLTDAVRATLGHIAATREWPHSTHEDLYSIAAALASGNGWPEEMEEFDQALKDAPRRVRTSAPPWEPVNSPEGKNLCAALGASMGRPDMLKFGRYDGDPDGPERDGLLFARATIELANRLADQEAVRS